ncbi:hypothetical protein PWR66_05270 [Paraburkholderia sp. A1RO-5]|uniref:hypothetical protein n=1 Tax=Paraburkholderia sp. A1RO-5 TaxID=3028369 RepID=UPI003B7B77F7
MINLTNDDIVFGCGGKALDAAVRSAMSDAAHELLRILGLTVNDLATVSTKTKVRASFAKFALLHTLKVKRQTFDEEYVRAALRYHMTTYIEVGQSLFYAVTLGKCSTAFEFKLAYARHIKRGVGMFLVALHSRRAITLPLGFDWPFPCMGDLGNHDVALGLSSELLAFVRSVNRHGTDIPHPAFASVGTLESRRQWFLTYGTKLLVATGWHAPSDGNLDDLIAIKEAEWASGMDARDVYSALLDVLHERYGPAFGVTPESWGDATRTMFSRHRAEAKSRFGLMFASEAGEVRSDQDVLAEILKATPASASEEAIRAAPRLPGLPVELDKLANRWLELEAVYMQVVQREGYKDIRYALGYLNIYLFYYLPYWFHRNSGTLLKFPDEPGKLIASVFVSRLMVPDGDVPKTFIEVMNAIHAHRKWNNNAYYGLLKQVEVFFDFLEQHNEDLPGCAGFRQPIADYVYPPTTRSQRTGKRPIPRRLFGFLLDYVEALRMHLYVVNFRILNGDLSPEELQEHIARTGNVIDTYSTAALVGFIPVLFRKNKTIPLRYIPDCLAMEQFHLHCGRREKLPQPHALNQILVALYTGLRHNHIQWLDARSFDSLVTDNEGEFAFLHVNTDKAMRHPWAPHVNFRVIDVLRSQRSWRDLIAFPGELHHYNDNPATKWPPILPLFAADRSGKPHPDTRYAGVWQALIGAMEGMLPELGLSGLQRLCALEPPGVTFNDPDARRKREEYGQKCKRVCELRIKSEITPHSARVTVVSQFATILPADMIGSRITGQAPGTVYYYAKLDEEQLAMEQTHQAMAMRERAYRNGFETLVGTGSKSSAFIHADNVNSNLARSLRVNLPETLISYGCISITMNEDATSGLDVLRETRGANAAENKTEICPYGNHCPPEVVKQWRGMHRCGLCQYAVRSIDHLPAVAAKVREFDEKLDELTTKIEDALDAARPPYTDTELDRLDDERSRLAEELAGWKLSEEVLNAARVRIATGQDDRRWFVQKPEIILQDLQRVAAPSNLTAYLLARLGECISYPTTESPQIHARFDLLRRELLARRGELRKAFDAAMPVNPAAECAGLLRTLVHANGLGYDEIVNLLDGDGHLANLSASPPVLLLQGD